MVIWWYECCQQNTAWKKRPFFVFTWYQIFTWPPAHRFSPRNGYVNRTSVIPGHVKNVANKEGSKHAFERYDQWLSYCTLLLGRRRKLPRVVPPVTDTLSCLRYNSPEQSPFAVTYCSLKIWHFRFCIRLSQRYYYSLWFFTIRSLSIVMMRISKQFQVETSATQHCLTLLLPDFVYSPLQDMKKRTCDMIIVRG